MQVARGDQCRDRPACLDGSWQLREKLPLQHQIAQRLGVLLSMPALVPSRSPSRVLQRVVRRSIQVHGSLGLTNELPLMTMHVASLVWGIGDGPTEVPKVALAKRVLGSYEASATVFADYHLPRLQELAEERYPQLVI